MLHIKLKLYIFFYALFLLCQLACFIITVHVGQLLVHFVPCCLVQLLRYMSNDHVDVIIYLNK